MIQFLALFGSSTKVRTELFPGLLDENCRCSPPQPARSVGADAVARRGQQAEHVLGSTRFFSQPRLRKTAQWACLRLCSSKRSKPRAGMDNYEI